MGHFRVLLLLATTATAAVSQTPSVTPAWTLTLDAPGDIVLSAWSSAANCVAVATNKTVHVFDSSGRPLWAWNYQSCLHGHLAPSYASCRHAHEHSHRPRGVEVGERTADHLNHDQAPPPATL